MVNNNRKNIRNKYNSIRNILRRSTINGNSSKNVRDQIRNNKPTNYVNNLKSFMKNNKKRRNKHNLNKYLYQHVIKMRLIGSIISIERIKNIQLRRR